MTCQDLVAFLQAYLGNELPPDRKASFERHLALCANCRTFLTQYDATIRLSRAACAAEEAPIPDELARAIRASIFST